jgi:hypothetical protein
MLNNFFKLNLPYDNFNLDQFDSHLRTSKHICNVLYEPNTLENKKISDVTFENVSFSKTTIENSTFTKCKFKDCLFIGTVLRSVEFHDCCFKDCNFFKSLFESVYAKPRQFRNAITEDKYSNIAVHLYHQLRENYYKESQREFKNEAEYYFGHWQRKNEFIQSKRNNKKWYEHQPQHIASWLYGYLLGYGYRLRNLVTTTLTSLILVMLVNHMYSAYLFASPVKPSIIKTVYFTITTMATIGASGYSPDTEIGYLFVVGNVLFGISILTATIGAIFKKVIR